MVLPDSPEHETQRSLDIVMIALKLQTMHNSVKVQRAMLRQHQQITFQVCRVA